MWYVGLDVHKRQSTFCVLDEGGRTVKTKTVHGAVDTVLGELAEIKGRFAVVYEASSNYGYVHDELSKVACRVVVAHPGHLRLIFRSKNKNDRADAHKLAKLLAMDLVPSVHVPSLGVRAWRGLIEYRQRRVAERTGVKNALRSLLDSRGVKTPKGLWSKKGLAWLKALELSEPLDALRRDELLDRLEGVVRSLRRVEKELNRIGRAHPGVALLMTIPGVGLRTAEAVAAYVDRPDRFHSNKAIGRYFGLVPCQDASAGKNRLGHITQEGPATVRRLLNQAAWQGVRRSAEIRAFFARVQRDDPKRKKIALVATMHYLARVMLAMLRSGEAWRTAAVAA